MKILKTKKLNISLCWAGLKGTMPKDFPSMTEMEIAEKILERLKAAIPEFVDIVEEGERLQMEIKTGKFDPTKDDKTRLDFNERANKLEGEKGSEITEVNFEDAEFNTFFQQFERWGKNWFISFTDFLTFRKDMNSTNQQPRGK